MIAKQKKGQPLRRVALIAALAATIGCRPEDAIRVYETPKTKPLPTAIPGFGGSPPATIPANRGEKTHRMLALIAPGGSQAWFFKLVGKIDQVAPMTEQVAAFYRAVTIGEDGKPSWRLPDGWQASPSAGMRLSTISVGEGLEISVIGLPTTGDWNAQVLDNVNRWRGQLGLPPTDADELANITTTVEGIDGAVIVDETGWFAGGMAPGGGGTPPFAGMKRPPSRSLPPAVIKRQAEPAAVAYETPDRWSDLGATMTRKINLTTGDGPDAASARASRWRAAGGMGDPTENVNRWRRLAGLPPISPEQVLAQAEAITIAGQSAQLFTVNLPVERTSTNSEEPAGATLAAMLPRGEAVWFFLLTGPAKTVEAEQERYREWLASIRFADQDRPKKYQSDDGDPDKPEEEPADGDR